MAWQGPLSGGGSLRAGEKPLPPRAADAVPWDSALPGLGSRPSSVSGVQATAEPLAGGDYTWRGVCECVRACGGGARPNLPGAVVGGVAEAGRASRGRARRPPGTPASGPVPLGPVAGS
ncbi:hypothetical protein J1605_001767 [Eschrichtius robustus]|uniref:Uncharacterized protein n=1 Tax=Eschrichtius robustus TaxID=9764 RepID=A0AB34I2B3_ESCRO|nr:hypothetical protein J1605_001767 [Eschrichtius robustus]